jgi:hypothetical protein
VPSAKGSTPERLRFRPKGDDEPSGDRILLRLSPGGRAEILCLTRPTPATRVRLRRFARNVIETPRFPRLDPEAWS